MSETKRTVEGRECCYCHRNLPITYFPIKPGMKHARYKMCRDYLNAELPGWVKAALDVIYYKNKKFTNNKRLFIKK